MKNILSIPVLLILLSFTGCSADDEKPVLPTPQENKTIFENNTGQPINQAIEEGPVWDVTITPSYTTSTINVDRVGTISKPWKVSVHLDMRSDYGRQYTLELFAPTGQSIKLFDQVNCSFASGNIMTFNSGAVGKILPYSYPVLTGTYLPSSSVIGPQQYNLATFFQDKEIDGNWTLKITAHHIDPDDVNGDPAELERLNGWKLEFGEGALE